MWINQRKQPVIATIKGEMYSVKYFTMVIIL